MLDKIDLKIREIVIDNLLSRVKEKGINIIHWIVTILTEVYWIYLLIGLATNLYTFALNTYYSSVNPFVEIPWLFNIIIHYLLPVALSYVVYRLMRYLRNMVGELNDKAMDYDTVWFIVGSYFIITKLYNLVFSIDFAANIIYRAVQYDSASFVDFVAPFISFIIPFVYILVGIRLIKKSQYLKESNE